MYKNQANLLKKIWSNFWLLENFIKSICFWALLILNFTLWLFIATTKILKITLLPSSHSSGKKTSTIVLGGSLFFRRENTWMWVRLCGPLPPPFTVPENQRTGQRTYTRRPILSKKKKLVTSLENFKKTWNRRLF